MRYVDDMNFTGKCSCGKCIKINIQMKGECLSWVGINGKEAIED